MTFEKNPYWYDADKVNVIELDFLLLDDDMLAFYNDGDLDFIDTFPIYDINDFLADPEFHAVDVLGTYYVTFNAESPIFEGKTPEEAACMRRAISILIDRDYICENIGKSGQIAANSLVPLGMSDGNGGAFKTDENDGYFDVHAASKNREEVIKEATKLLKAAGFKFGEDGKLSDETPLSLSYLTNDSTGHVTIAECIAVDLADVGIGMTIRTVGWSDMNEEKNSGNFDLLRNGWIADFNDPINMLEIWTTGSGYNDCHFGD